MSEEHYYAKEQAASDALEDKLDEAYAQGEWDTIEAVEKWLKKQDDTYVPVDEIQRFLKKLKTSS